MLRSLPRASIRTLHAMARELTRKNSRACAVILPLCRDLQVGRGPAHFRHSKEVTMATLRAGTTKANWLSKVLGERRGPRTAWHGTSELSPNNPKHHRIPTHPMKQEQQIHTYCTEQWPTFRGCKWPIRIQKQGVRAGMHQPNVSRKLQQQGSQGLKWSPDIYSW